MEEDILPNFGENQRSDGGRQLAVPSLTYEDKKYTAAEEQWTVFISEEEETMSDLKERLHIEQYQTVVFVNSNDLEESQKAKEEKKFLVGFTFARVEFKDTENPAIKVKGYIAVQTDIDTKSGKLYIEKKETEVMIAEMMLTDKAGKGSNSTCFVMKHFETGKKLAYKYIKKQASVNEVLACLELQDTETSPAVFCIKENENIEIFMELIAPRSNILLQRKNQSIIVRIIDYGSAIEIADNDKGLENKKTDLHKISEGISSLSRRCKKIEDDLLDGFRGDNPRQISTTEEALSVIQETSAHAEEFETSPPSSSDDYPYRSSSEEKSKEKPPNPSVEDTMPYMAVDT
ncbi:unnamed protein product [Mytilus coruscus]|uniref:Uncharacterized protein n=1 Tax=Mytilus coruscus TaxID=42192 RepID=A0A6J8BPU1_MYTCO|nr:unnamed protein product [Mytilus coruscus]